MSYTTIRISKDAKKKLERLKKKLGFKSISKALEFAIEIAEKESDKFSGDIDALLKALKFARDIGETNAENVDEYIYGR